MSAARNAEIVARLEEGEKGVDLAREYGLDPRRISQIKCARRSESYDSFLDRPAVRFDRHPAMCDLTNDIRCRTCGEEVTAATDGFGRLIWVERAANVWHGCAQI